MSKLTSTEIVKKMCAEKNISFDDVNKILDLYASDLSEDEIERRTLSFPQPTLAFASRLLLGTV